MVGRDESSPSAWVARTQRAPNEETEGSLPQANGANLRPAVSRAGARQAPCDCHPSPKGLAPQPGDEEPDDRVWSFVISMDGKSRDDTDTSQHGFGGARRGPNLQRTDILEGQCDEV